MINNNQYGSITVLLLVTFGMFLGIAATLGNSMLTRSPTLTSLHHHEATSYESKQSQVVHDGQLADGTNATNTTDFNTIVNAIESTDVERHIFVRHSALYTLVSELNNDEISQLLSQTWDSHWKVSKQMRAKLQSILLERLSMTSPKEAVDFVINESQGGADLTQSLIDIFAEWGGSDIDEAVAKATELPESSRRLALQGILRSKVNQPLDEQREFAKRLNLEIYFVEWYLASLNLENLSKPDLVWLAVIDVAEQDFTFTPQLKELGKLWYGNVGFKVLEQIRASMTNEEMEEILVASLLKYIANAEPDRAFDYAVTKLSGRMRLIAGEAVIGEWAIQDPATAFNAINDLETGALRIQLQKTAIYNWAKKDPEGVLENLSNFPRQTRTHAAVSAVGLLTAQAPESAVAWVLQLEDQIVQIQAANTLVSIWSQNDFEAARAWLQEEPAISDFRGFFYSTLVMALLETDPSGAFELALTLPFARGQIGFEAEVVSQIAFENIQLALALLPRVRESARRAFAYEKVGSTLVKNGDFRKAANLGLQLDESDHSNYYQYISYVWVNMDYKRLYEMLPELPNAEARSKAAYALCVFNDNYNSLTKEQVKELDQYLIAKDRDTLRPLIPLDNR